MRTLGHSLKAMTVLLNLLVFLEVVWGTVLAGAGDQPPPSEIGLPAGTRLVIPKAIMQQYQKEGESWGKPGYYLGYYYSFAESSLTEEDVDTFYSPFSREDGKEVGGKPIVVVDITKLKWIDEEKGIMITLEDIPIKYLHMTHDYFCNYLLPLREQHWATEQLCQSGPPGGR